MLYEENEDMLCNSSRMEPTPEGIDYTFSQEDLTTEPVTLNEFKNYADIDFATDDQNLNWFIRSAREQAEEYCQRSFILRTVTFTAFKCPKNYPLNFGKIGTITTSGFTNFGDMLIEGGEKISVSFRTDVTGINENWDIKLAIMSQALNLYLKRDDANIGFTNEFKIKLQKYRNTPSL